MNERVVICGAGIAGIGAAYFLTAVYGLPDVLVIDERPPLSLTSDKSTEAYRNFWPGPDDAMVAFMNHSIDLMEALARAHDNRFLMNRRGYLYATARSDVAEQLLAAAHRAAALGAGPVREHTSTATYQPSPPEGFAGVPDGVDVLVGRAALEAFPFLNPATTHAFHVRRAGWLSAHQLGMLLWERAREAGARLMKGQVVGVDTQAGRVSHVHVRTTEGVQTIKAALFINAAGPFAREVAGMLGVELPLFCERHRKWMFDDHLRVLPREAPLVIWTDPQHLPWRPEEREAIASDPEMRWLLDEFPPGVHVRPEGAGDSTRVLLLWAYHTEPVTPTFPLPEDPFFPEIVLRGITAAVPGFRRYWERMPRPVVDGGYYTKTPENLPLIGPLPVEGAYIIAALSGYGIMAACAAGDLLAKHIVGAPLPSYAAAFHPLRYTRPEVYPRLAAWDARWQL